LSSFTRRSQAKPNGFTAWTAPREPLVEEVSLHARAEKALDAVRARQQEQDPRRVRIAAAHLVEKERCAVGTGPGMAVRDGIAARALRGGEEARAGLEIACGEGLDGRRHARSPADE
jgi:hypothetical protein